MTPQHAHPQAQPGPVRTISGLPVGYQSRLDQMQYQLTEANRAIQMLMYERDAADSEACASEIGRLAAVGFMVGDEEVRELKAKTTPEARAAYIHTITTKYQRVGTDLLPPLMGDPTPGAYEDPAGRPTTEADMQAALKLAAGGRMDYAAAIAHVKSGGGHPQQPAPTMYGMPYPAGQPQAPYYPQPPQYAPQTPPAHYRPTTQPQDGFDPLPGAFADDPYAGVEPSANGRH